MEQEIIAGPIEGYKIVGNDMKCFDFKLKIGMNKLDNDNPLEMCKNGFHFCKVPSGPWSYHSSGKLFKIRAYDVLNFPETPGADYKLVCRRIELVEEIKFTGDDNTGDRNTGDRNTGNCNTGDRNTGNRNTGYDNTGDRNTGDRNTGDCNTGNDNTGYGNCGNNHSGALNIGDAPFYLFNKIVRDKTEIDFRLVEKLSFLLSKDDKIDPAPFLGLPNSSVKNIEKLHKEHIKARSSLNNNI